MFLFKKLLLPIAIWAFTICVCFAQEKTLDSVSIIVSGNIPKDSLIGNIMKERRTQSRMHQLYENSTIGREAYNNQAYQLLREKFESVPEGVEVGREDLQQLQVKPLEQIEEEVILQDSRVQTQEETQFFQERLIIEEEKEQEFQATIIVEDDLEAINRDEDLETDNDQVTNSRLVSRRRLRGPSQYDSRIEIRQLDFSEPWQLYLHRVSRSVGMIVPKEKLIQLSSTIYQIDMSISLQSRFGVCERTAFSDQPAIGDGTAFVIDQNTMLSAAHVLNRPASDYVVVFGFELANKQGAVDGLLHIDDIYGITKTTFLRDLDVVRFKVDKPLRHERLFFGNSENLPLKNEIYMLGHPLGLPLKATLNAGIVNNDDHHHFLTSLDSFAGNSGSPVLDYHTNRVIGILVSGGIDFDDQGGCLIENSCRIPYCEGEKVVRIERILERL